MKKMELNLNHLHPHRQHFIDLSQLSVDDINGLLLKAIFFAKNQPLVKKYSHKKFLFYFKEPSTRTSLSFQIAAHNLGIETYMLNEQMSSFVKGEEFIDALRVFEAMGFDGMVVRSAEDNLLSDYQNQTKLSFVNAGTGAKLHPSQALLDLATIHESFGRIDDLTIAIVGDIDHSRVASSTITLHKKLGNQVLTYSDRKLGSSWSEIEKKADVVMLLRIQKERFNKDEVIDTDHYLERHGLTISRYKSLKKGAIVMHPGPFNRNIEIDERLLHESNIKIFDQVRWGVPARMAIFDYILNHQE